LKSGSRHIDSLPAAFLFLLKRTDPHSDTTVFSRVGPSLSTYEKGFASPDTTGLKPEVSGGVARGRMLKAKSNIKCNPEPFSS
jgi:hypothetical protein